MQYRKEIGMHSNYDLPFPFNFPRSTQTVLKLAAFRGFNLKRVKVSFWLNSCKITNLKQFQAMNISRHV
jgi:hypothetical protein